MGNSGSNSKEEYHFGPAQPYPNPYYSGDPFAYVNPLPIPPKEPLPQAPYYGHHTPHHGPEEIRERMPEDRNGSFTRKRGNIMRSLSGLGKMIVGNASQKPDHPQSTWTYPDGTPFPAKKLELSPIRRPAGRGRSSSFSGRGKKEDRYYLFDSGVTDQEVRLSRWKSLNNSRPEPKRRRSEERYNYSKPKKRNEGYFEDWLGPSAEDNWVQHRRFRTEAQERKPRGISLDGYVPPEKRDRLWTYPDGTPYPKPNDIPLEHPLHDGPVLPDERISALAAAQSLQVPHIAHAFPRIPTPTAGPLPRVPSPIHFPTSALSPHPQPPSGSAMPVNPVSQPHFPPHPQANGTSIVTYFDPLHQTKPGLPDFINPEVTFSFDRASELCHFSYHGVVFGGRLYPTAFHLWEAMKFVDNRPDLAKKIRKLDRVRDAVKFSQELGLSEARSDWAVVGMQMLDEALYTKCRQHPSVFDSLVLTGHRHIVFLSQREPFWGWSTHSRKGENQLGQSLERVRERIFREGDVKPPLPEWKIKELELLRIPIPSAH